MYICVYLICIIYIYVYTYVCMYVIYTYISLYMILVYVHSYAYMYISLHVFIYTYIHTYMNMYINIYTCMYTNKDMYINIYINIHMYIRHCALRVWCDRTPNFAFRLLLSDCISSFSLIGPPLIRTGVSQIPTAELRPPWAAFENHGFCSKSFLIFTISLIGSII